MEGFQSIPEAVISEVSIEDTIDWLPACVICPHKARYLEYKEETGDVTYKVARLVNKKGFEGTDRYGEVNARNHIANTLPLLRILCRRSQYCKDRQQKYDRILRRQKLKERLDIH